MKSRWAKYCMVALALLIATSAFAEDPRSRRLSVRNGTLYRGSSQVTLRAIEAPGLFVPGATEEQWVKTFARVSECGATGVWFELEGVSADGSAIDSEHIDALREVKSHSIYRYISPICRLFGEGAPETLDERLKIVRTVAAAFKDDHAMMIAIDGPFAPSLAAEMKRLAPKLIVLAPESGDVDWVASPQEAKAGRAALLWGQLPKPVESPLHCTMPAGDASYAAFEEANMDPIEKAPWEPTTNGLSEAEIAEGFVSLFDGESFDGWVITGRNKEGWTVRDGTIEFVTVGGGVVRSRNRYDDFVLRLDWKLYKEQGNSGVFIRAPRTNRASKIGLEFQLMGDYGAEPGIHTSGAIYDVLAPKTNASNPVGEWNSIELRIEGPRYTATLNGVVVQDLNFDDLPEMRHRLRRGFIALQDHQNKVGFRNIRIKEL